MCTASLISDFIDTKRMVWFGIIFVFKGGGFHYLSQRVYIWQGVPYVPIYLIHLGTKGDKIYSCNGAIVWMMMHADRMAHAQQMANEAPGQSFRN